MIVDPAAILWTGTEPGAWLIEWADPTGLWTVIDPAPLSIDWAVGLNTGMPAVLPADVQVWAAHECPGCGPWTPLGAAPVAEPAAVALFGVGVLAVVLMRRRRV